MQKETISILGCGWLGLPLAKSLIAQGYNVKGSTTSEAKLDVLQEAGIEPYLVTFEPEIEAEDAVSFFQSDILIVNIPPMRREDIVEYHITQFSSLIDALSQSPVRSLLMVSSTSVYPSLNQEVIEEDAIDPESPSGQALLMVEEMLMQESGFQTTIVRFGGLVGYDRTPARYLSALKEITNPNHPMNLIHQDDCIGIISEIIRLQQWGEVFNACSPVHPLRSEYYNRAADDAGVARLPLGATDETMGYKIVNSEKVVKALNYTFKHPNAIE